MERVEETLRDDSISSPVVGITELARVASTLAHLLESSSSSVVLGKKSKYSDPILETLDRLKNRDAPVMIERTVIPGDPRTKEVFDMRKVLFDVEYLGGCEEFRKDIALPTSDISYDGVVARVGKWTAPFDVTGPVSVTAEDDDVDDDVE